VPAKRLPASRAYWLEIPFPLAGSPGSGSDMAGQGRPFGLPRPDSSYNV